MTNAGPQATSQPPTPHEALDDELAVEVARWRGAAPAAELDGRDVADLADDPAYQELQDAMAELEAGHQRWKTTHRGMAGKMLGEV